MEKLLGIRGGGHLRYVRFTQTGWKIKILDSTYQRGFGFVLFIFSI